MAKGEVLEFEEYVRTRQDALLRSARRLVPDPIEAQDLLQTALDRVWHEPVQRARALDGLVADGLVEPLPDGMYRLPAS